MPGRLVRAQIGTKLTAWWLVTPLPLSLIKILKTNDLIYHYVLDL